MGDSAQGVAAVEDSEEDTTMVPLTRLLVRPLALPSPLRSDLPSPLLSPRTEIGTFIHAVEGEMLCASTMPSKVRSLPCSSYPARTSATPLTPRLQVPYFNAPIYLPTKAAIGKVDEILGPISPSPSTPQGPALTPPAQTKSSSRSSPRTVSSPPPSPRATKSASAPTSSSLSSASFPSPRAPSSSAVVVLVEEPEDAVEDAEEIVDAVALEPGVDAVEIVVDVVEGAFFWSREREGGADGLRSVVGAHRGDSRRVDVELVGSRRGAREDSVVDVDAGRGAGWTCACTCFLLRLERFPLLSFFLFWRGTTASD